MKLLFAGYRFLRHAFWRGRLLGGPRWAIYHSQESLGSKVYVEKEIRSMLARYEHGDLRFSYYEQLIRKGARFKGLRRFTRFLRRRRMLWYVAVKFESMKVLEPSPSDGLG